MKKIMSILLAALMAVSAFAVTALPVFADDAVVFADETVASIEVTDPAKDIAPTLQVNGVVTTTDITYVADPDNENIITFTYNGEGELVGWETNLEDLGFVEGVDYTLTENEDGTLTIEFISDEAIAAWKNGEVTVNAIVDFGEEDEATTKSPATTKANGSSKSPSTGASTAVVAATVATAGAGIAVLAALKKRDAE